MMENAKIATHYMTKKETRATATDLQISVKTEFTNSSLEQMGLLMWLQPQLEGVHSRYLQYN